MLAAYITFDGNTEEAFQFYASALGGEIDNLQRFGSAPNGATMPEEIQKKVMHISLKTPEGYIMGNDHVDFMGDKYQKGNNFSMSLHPETEAASRKAFESLAQGGTVIVPFEKAPWGDYFGMIIDKFGIKWMINYHQQ